MPFQTVSNSANYNVGLKPTFRCWVRFDTSLLRDWKKFPRMIYIDKSQDKDIW